MRNHLKVTEGQTNASAFVRIKQSYTFHWAPSCLPVCSLPSSGRTGADPGFWSEGSQQRFDPKGGPEKKKCENKGFPLKLPENCMILKKSGARGAQAPRAPWIRHCNTHTHTCTHVISFLSSLLFSTSFFEARKAGKSWKHSKGPWKRLRWRSFAVWRDVSTSDQTGGAQVPQTDEDALRLVFLPSSLEFWRSHTTNAPAWQNQGKNL